MRKVMKEIADLGIVTVAQNTLILEMFRVMPQLLLDVRELGVKLVLFCSLRGAEASVQRLTRHSSQLTSF